MHRTKLRALVRTQVLAEPRVLARALALTDTRVADSGSQSVEAGALLNEPALAGPRAPGRQANEHGQVLFMVALAGLTLMVGLALVAHWGNAAIDQARAQSFADAIALAAVSGDSKAVVAVTDGQRSATGGQLRFEVSVLPRSAPVATSPSASVTSTGTSAQVQVVFNGQVANAVASVDKPTF